MCPGLDALDLSGNKGLTDAVLATLKQLRPLREVHLENTSVTQPWYPQTE